MKTIERKALSYIDRIFKEILNIHQNEPWPQFKEALAQIYMAGAKAALAGQWRRYPDEDFPESGIEYVVLTDSGDLCAVNKYAKKDDVKQYTNIVAWMPIIRPPKDESE